MEGFSGQSYAVLLSRAAAGMTTPAKSPLKEKIAEKIAGAVQ
jgi:hypothetical protein